LRPRRQSVGAVDHTVGVRRASNFVLAVVMVGLAACSPAPEAQPALARPTLSPPTTSPAPTVTTPPPVEVRYRIERRTTDAATSSFAEVVRTTLDDPRGWTGADFALVEDPDARYLMVLAEGEEVDEMCAPYRTGGRFSCQNGPVVALNADRWRSATERWTGTLGAYRQMLVNHEVGHLLGRHHPSDPQCPAPAAQRRSWPSRARSSTAACPTPGPSQRSSGQQHDTTNPWPRPTRPTRDRSRRAAPT